MSNLHEPCKRKKFVGEMKSASKVKKASTAYVDSSSSSGDYRTESSESEGSDECRRDRSRRRGKQLKTAPISAPSEELSEDSSSDDESVEPDDLQMPSKDNASHRKKKDYVLQGKYNLTGAQQEKIDALVRKIQPTIPVLVVMMKKTNVKQYPDLVILKDYAIKHFPRKNQTIALKLPGQSKDWSCDFRIRPDGSARNLYLGNFVSDNRVRVGDLCIFQPMTEVDESRFTMTVHLLHEASFDHYPVRRNDIGTNHGITQKKIANSDDTPKGFDDDTKQPSGRKRYASYQMGSSKGHRNTTKRAAKPTSFEKSGDDGPFEYDSFESDDDRAPRGPNYGLSLGSYLSEAQYGKVIAHLERIQPETAVFIAVMSQRDIQLPTPLLIISKEHAIAHFPHENASVTLHRPDKIKKWHPRFYIKEDRSEYMLAGHWLDFICDNSVQEGDICIFVPEKEKGGERSKFTVHLLCGETTRSRGGTGGGQGAGLRQGENDSSESNMPTVSDEPLEGDKSDGLIVPPYILPFMNHLSPSQKKIVEAKVQAIQSEIPIYVSIMKKSNIGAIKHHMLELGSRYVAAAHLPDENHTIVLRCKGQMWKTKMVVHPSGKRWFISGGWSKFAQDNRLRIGDICLFEKKNKGKLTMKVHIIPASSASS